MLHYNRLHYITWHDTTLHYLTLHYITLHYIRVHLITFFCKKIKVCGHIQAMFHSYVQWPENISVCHYASSNASSSRLSFQVEKAVLSGHLSAVSEPAPGGAVPVASGNIFIDIDLSQSLLRCPIFSSIRSSGSQLHMHSAAPLSTAASIAKGHSWKRSYALCFQRGNPGGYKDIECTSRYPLLKGSWLFAQIKKIESSAKPEAEQAWPLAKCVEEVYSSLLRPFGISKLTWLISTVLWLGFLDQA